MKAAMKAVITVFCLIQQYYILLPLASWFYWFLLWKDKIICNLIEVKLSRTNIRHAPQKSDARDSLKRNPPNEKPFSVAGINKRVIHTNELYLKCVTGAFIIL